MDYAIIENGVIKNVIVIDNEEDAAFFHALPLKEGQGIGDIYEAPIVKTSIDNLRDVLNVI